MEEIKLKKLNSDLIFDFGNETIRYNFKEQKYFNKMDKEIKLSTFKNYFRYRTYNDLKPLNDDAKKFLYLIYVYSEKNERLTNVGTLLSGLLDKPHVECVYNFLLSYENINEIDRVKILKNIFNKKINIENCKIVKKCFDLASKITTDYRLSYVFTEFFNFIYEKEPILIGQYRHEKLNIIYNLIQILIEIFDSITYIDFRTTPNILFNLLSYGLKPKDIISYLRYLENYEGIDVQSRYFYKDYLDYIENEISLFDYKVKNKKEFYPKFFLSKKQIQSKTVGLVKSLIEESKLDIEYNYTQQTFNYYLNQKYIIERVKNLRDLLLEGDKLNHCVGSYDKKVREETCQIYFIRLKAQIDEPLYTLELRLGENGYKIEQVRGKFNEIPTDEEVLSFLKEWETFIKRLTKGD